MMRVLIKLPKNCVDLVEEGIRLLEVCRRQDNLRILPYFDWIDQERFFGDNRT
jgi:hypothetical protein